jgi:acyl carrier protein
MRGLGVPTITQTDVEEGIKQVLTSHLGVAPALLADSDPRTPLLGRGVGLDSVEAMALVVRLEDAFDIEVDDEDLTAELFRDIGTLAAYVLRRIAEQKDRSAKGEPV